MIKLLDYKKEIVVGLLSALATASLSLAVGLYSMNKNFQLTQNKELLFSLRTDISNLRKVERELDENLKLLLNSKYQLKVEIERKNISLPPPSKKDSDKEFSKWFTEYMESILGARYIVKSVQIPSDKFLIDAWQPNGPVVSDIDFELIQELNELYRKLTRINKYLENLASLTVGTFLDESMKNGLEQNIPLFNAMVSEISQSKILQLKNKVIEETNILNKRWGALTGE